MSYRPTAKPAQLACPTNKNDKKNEGAYSDDDEVEDYSQDYEEDANNAYTTGNAYANQQSEAARLAQREEELRHKALEVDHETWDTAEFYFDEVIDLNADYVVESNNGGIGLKDGGVITLRVKDGSLQLGTLDREGDFKVKSVIPTTSGDGKLKKKAALPLSSDIVKSAYLENFKIDGWSERVLVRLSTIPKFQEEGFYGDSPNVAKMILPGEWAATNHRIKLFDRVINKGMLDFQTQYPDASPENLHKGIQKPINGFCAVVFNSPVVRIINLEGKAHVPGGEYLEPTIKETNQVLIPKQLVKIYTEKALKSMSYGISYGNVTSDRFTIQFEAPIPRHLAGRHAQFIKTDGKTGRQYMAFADPYKNNVMGLGAALNENIKTRSALFKDDATQSLRLQGKLVLQYKSGCAQNHS